MGISMNYSAITLTDGDYTFEDIFQYSQSHGNTYCKKLGNAYLISTDLIIGDGSTEASLQDSNVSVTIEGDLFQIKKKSFLKLGEIDPVTEATSGGCFISCPNIKLAYGFGSTSVISGATQSGDIFLYDSFVDIFGFWGFFGGNSQHCEVIDCLINGFGRIEGENSKIRNVISQKSHGRYGTLSTKGTVHTFEEISSKATLPYNDYECSVYFNPEFAPGLRIVGGTYDGYEDLFYIENRFNYSQTEEELTATIVDAEIKNGFGAYFTDAYTKFKVAYTFSPVFMNENNNKLSYIDVVITDEDDNVVFNGQSDADGKISFELIQHEATKTTTKDYSYYNITATSGSVSVTRKYETGKTFVDCPFYVVQEGGTGGGDCCLEDIQAMMTAMQDSLTSTMNTNKNQIEGAINVAKSQINNKIETERDVINQHTTDSKDIIEQHITNEGDNIVNDIDIKINANKNAIVDAVVNLGDTISEESNNKGFV